MAGASSALDFHFTPTSGSWLNRVENLFSKITQQRIRRGVFRWPLAIWDAVFTKSGAYVPSKEHDAAWNRGAYLVEGLGHCGACHTPRGWATLFLANCVSCHGADGKGRAPYIPPLAGNPVVLDSDPSSLINLC